jgi:hypothetical protein
MVASAASSCDPSDAKNSRLWQNGEEHALPLAYRKGSRDERQTSLSVTRQVADQKALDAMGPDEEDSRSLQPAPLQERFAGI